MTDAAEELSEPMTIGVDAYISEDYARAERDRLWRRVWLQVGRVEELPEVGSYLTYDILDDSIIVVRTGPAEFAAHHNVCMHRGRRLIDTPNGARNAVGRARKSFVCGFHGWTYGLDGACTHIREQDDWKGALTPRNTHLAPVRVDTWGGWLFVSMDPDIEPLADYLFPAAKILDPFGLENMRYKWRKWLYFDCNWKVALEAFNETYHVFTTHPEFNRFGEFKGWAKAQGRHSNIGYDAPKGMDETKSKIRLGTGDPRISTAEMQVYTMEETNATTTQTLVNAAKRLVDELPEGTPADKVLEHWLASARRDDEARGVIWPTIPADVLGQSGTAWQIFPNFQIGQGLTSALCYSARPDPGYDPNRCIFEVAVFELYPAGQEPATEWVYTPQDSPNWLSVLPQDFSNMAAVQQGMKSAGFPGTLPNPYRERSTVNLHHQLAKYMGTGEPRACEEEPDALRAHRHPRRHRHRRAAGQVREGAGQAPPPRGFRSVPGTHRRLRRLRRDRPVHDGDPAGPGDRERRRGDPRRRVRRAAGRGVPEEGRRRRCAGHRDGRRLRWCLVLEQIPRDPVRQRRLLLHPVARGARFHAVEEVRRRAEIFAHCRTIGKHFGLYDGALFSTQVRELRWDDAAARWRITTDRGDDIAARFVVMAQAPTTGPNCPGFPG